MKGSLAKARVLYAPVEEIGSEGRLLRACRIHMTTFLRFSFDTRKLFFYHKLQIIVDL